MLTIDFSSFSIFLEHENVKAFVTHGGLMSTQESIYAGVPLVGIPLFADQPINVRLQVKRNVASMVGLKDLSEKTFTRAIKRVLHDPMYK